MITGPENRRLRQTEGCGRVSVPVFFVRSLKKEKTANDRNNYQSPERP